MSLPIGEFRGPRLMIDQRRSTKVRVAEEGGAQTLPWIVPHIAPAPPTPTEQSAP